MYKLSPSDFRYLWQDCKHCFYRKVKQGITLPSIGLPGIFSKMNGMLQAAIQGMSLESVNPVLPHGIIEVKEGFLRSKPIPPANDCFISGRFDILSRLKDGSYAVIDFKITDPSAEKVQKFTNQLHAYKFSLENPGNGAPAKKVTSMGVVVVSPDEIAFKGGNVIFNATPSWFEIKEDMTNFFSYISDVSKLLNGPLPAPSATCHWCQYRAKFSIMT